MLKMVDKGVELEWPSKKSILDRVSGLRNTHLPFQVVETINETKATREAKKTNGLQTTLYDLWSNGTGESVDSGWKNKLIWGDNKYVIASLLRNYAGKIDLIYIDPPFATGADFFVQVSIHNTMVGKEPTAIEQKAYRDTWGRGLESYLDMMHERLYLMHQLLSDQGSIYVHTDWHVGHYLKLIMDEIFGRDNFLNEIVWQRFNYHADANKYGIVHDYILFYSKTSKYIFNKQFTELREEYQESHFTLSDPDGRRYSLDNPTAPGHGKTGKPMRFGDRLIAPPPGAMWRWRQEKIDELMAAGKIVFTASDRPRVKRYLDESFSAVHSIWQDVKPVNSQAKERLEYNTQKPEALLERIIKASSNENSIVADFFCGSGTTLAVAEKLKRRWIGCDLGRFAIHTTRKRLMEIENCGSFEILNLGKYERQIWQESSFAKGKETVLYEYLAFILKLYAAEPLAGFQQIHGRKGRALIHIGAVDAPVTIDEVTTAIDECMATKQSELHVLGWEWEMGMHDLLEREAKQSGIKLRLLTIPNEVMETSAIEKGDIAFFDLAYFKANVAVNKNGVSVELQDFVIPNTELVPDEVRNKISHWSDFIDYWAVDFDFHDDTFMNNWTSYRTKDNTKLVLKSDPYKHQKYGRHKIVVKVIDIFGIDTTQAFEVDV